MEKADRDVVIYLREDGKPTSAIAIRYFDNGTYKVAGAFCNPKDNFIKKVARAKALGRLDGKEHIELSNDLQPKDVIDDMCKMILELYRVENPSKRASLWIEKERILKTMESMSVKKA